MQIIDVSLDNPQIINQIANILVEAFKGNWSDAWTTIEDGLAEVNESLESGKISRVAIDDNGRALGWVGAIPRYSHAWEMHPLVVDPKHQGQGIGRALVTDLEILVAKKGGITIYLGTDDEADMTTLSKTELYPNVFEHVAKIKNLRRHPYEFYQKVGFVIVGVIPDANGWGKPDIIMAKRVGK